MAHSLRKTTLIPINAWLAAMGSSSRIPPAFPVAAALLSLFAASQAIEVTESWANSEQTDRTWPIDDAYALTHTPPHLISWGACAPHGTLSDARRLCFNPKDATNDADAYATQIDNNLGQDIYDEDMLCRIDNALVDVSNTCPTLKPDNDWKDVAASELGGLMQTLADSWRRQGALNRADRLYYQAYAMTLRERGLVDYRAFLMRQWADLKMDLGQREQARRLANLQLETVRESYACQFAFRTQLVAALRFEAKILEKLGDVAGSRADRDEAGELAKMPDACQGTACPSEPVVRECR